MATGDKLVFGDIRGNRLFVNKDGVWYGFNKNRQPLDLNNLILTVEAAGFVIDRVEKIKGKVKLVLEDEAIERDLM